MLNVSFRSTERQTPDSVRTELSRSAVNGLTLCERSLFLINKMIPTDKNIGHKNKPVVARTDTASDENSISCVFLGMW